MTLARTQIISSVFFLCVVVLLYGSYEKVVFLSHWPAYILLGGLAIIVILAYRPGSLFYPPLLLYLWYTTFNLQTVLLLHLGQDDGVDFFGITIYPEPEHFRLLMEGQFFFAIAILSVRIVTPQPVFSSKLPVRTHAIAQRYWWAVYGAGVAAIAYLMVKGGGLDAAAVSRKARAVGAGWAIIMQYSTLIGIGLYMMSRRHKGLLHHLTVSVVLSVPLILTHERSFVLAVLLAVLAFHSIFTGKLRNRHLLLIGPALVAGLLLMLVWRIQLTSAYVIVDDYDWIGLLSKDASMNTGYLVYRELDVTNESGAMRTLMLTFSFLSQFLVLILGTVPVSPNNAFTDAAFPQVFGTSTFSMGPLGEAHYLFGEWRFVYGFIVFGLVHFLSDVFGRRNALFMILLSGFMFRLAKGGLTGGMQAVWIVAILLMLLHVGERALHMLNGGQRRTPLP